jgi:hypothetical protein
MVVHYIVYSIIAALSLVAVYATGMSVQMKTPAKKQEAEEIDGAITDSQWRWARVLDR